MSKTIPVFLAFALAAFSAAPGCGNVVTSGTLVLDDSVVVTWGDRCFPDRPVAGSFEVVVGGTSLGVNEPFGTASYSGFAPGSHTITIFHMSATGSHGCDTFFIQLEGATFADGSVFAAGTLDPAVSGSMSFQVIVPGL